MKSFFKFFFASCLSLIVFLLFLILVFSYMINSLLSPGKPEVKSNSVLVLDLSKTYHEQGVDGPLAFIENRTTGNVPGIHEVYQMLDYARTDSSVKGMYIKAGRNPNGFGTSDELRNAVMRFKQDGKFVIAYGEAIDQKSYYVASAADKVYCHPNGGIDWSGFSMNYMFFKKLIDKLEINPQIFYAGKYKSATEPFRVEKMTEPNRQQTSELLQDIYGQFLMNTASSRKIDTATLHQLAINGSIRQASDAVQARLIDAVLYDDQVKAEITERLGIKENEQIRFLSLEEYAKARDYRSVKGDKIAVIYAEGNIVDGKTESERVIASENFINLIRKVRLDKESKAVVLRVNSPGGSALASDGIWREITLLKKEKPVVVSMGDYAASGGYYIACAADSIFAEPGTLTGSIGVFGVLPDLKKFFNDKLGITFDGVKTAPYADMGDVTRPLTEPEKRIIQSAIDTIYDVFKSRVAGGRNLDMAFVDSIAQGHVYTGNRAVEIKLVDRIGHLPDAVRSAASMAKAESFWIKEYPEKKNFLQQLMSGNPTISIKERELRKTLGDDRYRYYMQLKELEQLTTGPQARMLAIPQIN